MNELEREIKRLSNLKNYKDYKEEDLLPVAEVNLAVRHFKTDPLFFYDGDDPKIEKQVKADQKLAEERFKNYLENCKIESQSDLDTLSSLVYNEVFEKRLQRELNKLQQSGRYPPDKLTKQLTDIQNQKLSLKVKLGIDKSEEESDDLTAYQRLEKRVYDHIQEHKHEHTIGLGWQCDKCGHKDWESYLLWHKVDNFKHLKHPWFVGRWLCNYEILKDVKEGNLSKEDAIRYLMCAGQGIKYLPKEDRKYCSDYIDFLLENWTEITDYLVNKNNE